MRIGVLIGLGVRGIKNRRHFNPYITRVHVIILHSEDIGVPSDCICKHGDERLNMI